MKNVVSFSGGRTPAYLCWLMKQKHDDVDFIYMDTGAEHPKTYEFIQKVNEEFLDNKLVCLRVKINSELGKGNSYDVVDINDCKPDLKPFKDMMGKYGTPYNPSGGFCTLMMKTEPFDRYCKGVYGEYTSWLGIRKDEPKRLKDMQTAQIDAFGEQKESKHRYLAEISDFDKQDILDWWSDQPFNLEIEPNLGNCVFCIKKGANLIALAERDEPEMAQEFITAYKKAAHRPRNDKQSKEIMYRDGNSLESIIAKHSDFTDDEIRSTIRSMKRYDTGSCTESCEAFVCSTDNYELFD